MPVWSTTGESDCAPLAAESKGAQKAVLKCDVREVASLHREGPCTLWTYGSSRGRRMKKNPLFSVAEEERLSGEEFFEENRTSLVPDTYSLKKSIGNYGHPLGNS